jgi:predicted nuclease of predicted toxin-antitoxin system
MRILLDECVNPRLSWAFTGHEVQTVVEMGWGGITNGKLLALAQQQFDVFVTIDQNLEHQQNVASLRLGVVVVVVPDNNIRFFKPLFAEVLDAIQAVAAGKVIRVVSPLVRS